MALNFPANPVPGDTYSGDNGVLYTYDGVKWSGAGVEPGLTLPVASTTSAGVVQVDGNTITITNGVISAANEIGPGGINTIENGDSNVAIITPNGAITVNANNKVWSFGTDANLTLPTNGIVRYANGVSILSGLGGSYGNTQVAAYLPTYTGNIAGNIVKNGRTWAFGTDGNLTVPGGGTITAPNAQEFQLQARDTNSLLRNEINLDPNNGTYMSVWSGELNTSFSTSDWATASWVNEGGVGGAYFTNAETLQDFWTTGIGSFVYPIAVSINGGARTPVQYDGTNGEQYGVLLFTDAFPVSSPITITSLTFYYRTKNSIDIDYNNGQMLLEAQSMNLNLETSNTLDLRSGQNLNLRGLGVYPVRIYANNNSRIWEFDSTGSLTLPREGKIYGIGDGGPGGDRYGYIAWAGNSSGDGSGFTTMRLVPDQQGLEDLDTYIILDPAYVDSPGSIHIRAGGTRDNSLANLYLGGANSHVKIGAGVNPPVTVMANNRSWTFGNTGNLTFPGNLVIAGNTNVFGTDSALIQSTDDLPLIAISSGANGAIATSWVEDIGNIGTSNIASVYANPTVGSKIVRIAVGQNGGAGPKLWDFGNTGTTRFPDGTILAPAGQNITMQSDQNSQLLYQNANVAVAPNVPTNTTFSVQPNFATLVVGYQDGNSAQQDNTWLWNIDGMTLPEGGTITEGGGISGAIRLTPAGGANSNQALVIYPTAGAPEGDHIHLTAGGGSTELYLGNDFHYVKLVDSGNIELRAATANLSAQASWEFDTTGNIDARQALGIKVPNGVPSNVAVINSTTGSWESNPNLSLATTGGSGTGLTVNVANTGGYASTIEIATAGTGYTNGDLITVTSGTSNATFTIVIAGRNTWQFGTNGNLTLPEDGTIKFANGVPILDTITGVTSINTSVATSSISDASGDYTYGALSYDYAVNGVTSGGFTISYSAPLVYGNVDISVGNVIASNVSTGTVITPPATFANLVAVSGARAFVNDANIVAAGNFGAAISGGGSNTAPVWSDGVSWYIG